MLPQITNILYATDLSDNARYAYKYAASLAQQYGANITILHVMEKLSAETFLQIQGYVGEEKWKKLQEEKQADFISTIKGRLGSFCDEISNEVDACTFQVDKIIVKEGIAADEQHRQPVGVGHRRSRHHVRASGTDGGGGDHDLAAPLRLGVGDRSKRHRLLVVSTPCRKDIPYWVQRLGQRDHIAVTEDSERPGEQRFLGPVDHRALGDEVLDDGLCRREPNGVHEFAPSVLRTVSR